MFCSNCGNEIKAGDCFCSKCGFPSSVDLPKIPRDVAEKRTMAGLLGILLGGLGIHKFYLGFNGEGIIQIVISLLSCGILGTIGFIEGLIYLTKSDEAFYQDYIVNKKKWF